MNRICILAAIFFIILNLILIFPKSVYLQCNLNYTDNYIIDTIYCTGEHLYQIPLVSPFTIHLNLSNNDIGELKQNSFAHLSLLLDLDLSFNKIVHITDRVFAGLGSLEKLYLNNNQIKNIEYYGFRNLHQLKELYLHFNIIHQLDLNVFNELFKMKHLSLLTNMLDNDLNTICQHNFSDKIKITFSSIYCFRVNGVENRNKKTISNLKIMPKEFKTIKIIKEQLPKVEQKNVKFNQTPAEPIGNKNKIKSTPILTSVPNSIYRIKLGSEIKLMCDAIGIPKPHIKWIRNGRAISLNATLILKNILPEDEGIYECIARNINGRAAKEVKLIIIGAISPNSPLNSNREFLEKIINAVRDNKTVPVGDLITNDITKFVELNRLLIAYSDNGTQFKAEQISESNLLTQTQQMVMNNYTGCMGGARMEYFNCNNSEYDKYYSITGICNNRNNPSWGSSAEPFLRLLPPDYDDGFLKPIGWFGLKTIANYSKPNTRSITEELLSSEEITDDPWNNHMLMQFGQFLDHDLTFAALSNNHNMLENDIVDCERTCVNVEPCYSIPFIDVDMVEHCIEFKRSAEYCGTGYTSVVFGKLIKREQINMITSFIDGSQIYGNNAELAEYLRDKSSLDNGFLNATIDPITNRTYLPLNNLQSTMDCQPEPKYYSDECFLAGDHRANEQLGLLVFHNLWLRQHNRLATKLKQLNLEWTGEQIFQEARKIVAAQLQIITYRDWLPLILGKKGMKMLKEYTGYNRSVNPSIANSFATAAMRFGHTLVNKHLIRKLFVNDKIDSDVKQHSTKLHKAFFRPNMLLNLTDSVLFGLLVTPLKKPNPQQAITDELTKRLFKLSRYTPLDLASINIQRGRDHGLPNYNEWRKFCGMKKVNNFDDLKYEIRNKIIRNKLAKLYGHPNNIDLYVGGILEDSDEDSKIGPTFRCLLVNQFQRLRDGDRLFYQNKGVFTEKQLKELMKTSLSKIICNNADNLKNIIKNSFLLPKHQSWINCDQLNDIDLTYWKQDFKNL